MDKLLESQNSKDNNKEKSKKDVVKKPKSKLENIEPENVDLLNFVQEEAKNANDNISPKENLAKSFIVMQVLPALNSGGVERGTVDIANFLVKSGKKSIVVSSGGRLELFLNKEVKHIKMPVDSKNPFTIFLNIYKLRKLILENNVDILHVRSRAPAWSCFYAIQKTKCKFLSTFHGTHSLNFIGSTPSAIKKAYNQIMLKASKVIAVSNFIKDYLRDNYAENFSEDKVEVVHRGVDVKVFDPAKISREAKVNLIKQWQIPDDKKLIMLPGRITPWKGHEFLIDSLRMLKRDDYFCLFVGDFASKGEYKKKLEQKITDLKLEGKVRFVGSTSAMATAYSICDVIISASIHPEAFGRVAIEAQAMKKVVIATNIGGSIETVIDGKTGFLVEPNNTRDLANRIDEILSLEQSQREEIGQRARDHVVENFSNDLMFNRTLKIYQNLLA